MLGASIYIPNHATPNSRDHRGKLNKGFNNKNGKIGSIYESSDGGDGVGGLGLIRARICSICLSCGKYCMCTNIICFASHISLDVIRFFPTVLAENLGFLHFIVWIAFCGIWYLQCHSWSLNFFTQNTDTLLARQMNRKSSRRQPSKDAVFRIWVFKLDVAAVYILLMLYLICYCSAMKSGFLAFFLRCNRIFPTSHHLMSPESDYAALTFIFFILALWQLCSDCLIYIGLVRDGEK